MKGRRMSRVVCVGSINVDVIARAPSLPAAGETIVGSLVEILPGGKGANQAVAALRMGVPVALVGAIGTDEFAKISKSFLEREGFQTTWISQAEGPTGTALIVVDRLGENSIVIVPGANSFVSPSSIDDVQLASGDVCLLQNEIPEDTNLAVLEAARNVQAITVLNLAPYRPTDPEVLEKVTFLVVNEIEFAKLTNTSPDNLTRPSVTGMLAEGAGFAANVLVTLGSEGVVARLDGEVTSQSSYSVNVVDTTGAGDAFCGAFGAALALGSNPVQALDIANAAAALSVQIPGAGPSMPRFDEVTSFMAQKS
jgi:ribokinase